MKRLTGPDGSGPAIAIVGGGASGSLTALHLLRHAAARSLALRIVLIDRFGRHGLGQAYSTAHEAHLLNTVAGQMSALPGDPDHLVRWSGGAPEEFLPRRAYGEYLRWALAEAEREAAPWAALSRISSEITTISGRRSGHAMRLAGSGGWMEADLAVLAIGNLPAGLPFAAPSGDRIVADPWRPGALDEIRDGEPVLIVGTGLTMIDLAVAISDRRPGTPIYAVSRHGLLPRPHPGTAGGDRSRWLPFMRAEPGQVGLREIMAQVRTAAAADPEHWHDVMAAIRPYTPRLWHGLSDADKLLFLRQAARYWEVHRHLVPPATARRLAALQDSGQLTLLTGRVLGADEVAGQLHASIRLRDGGTRELTAGWIVSAAGAPADISTTADPLLTSLLASGLARPDSLRLGLDASTDGAIIDRSGRASDVLFTLGPPLRGLWYETTAIAEIRTQAADLAGRLAGRIAADGRRARRGDSAA